MAVTLDERVPASKRSKSRHLPVTAGAIDCDIHPGFARPDEIMPFLATRWHEYVRTFGGLYRQALADTLSHPRMSPDVARADA